MASHDLPPEAAAVKIPFDELRSVSMDIWGSPVYGDTAENWVNYCYWNWRETRIYERSGVFETRIFGEQDKVIGKDKALIMPAVRHEMPDCPYVLKLEKVKKPNHIPAPKFNDDGDYLIADIELGNAARVVSKENFDYVDPPHEYIPDQSVFVVQKSGFSDLRLRQYLQKRGLDSHSFRGSLGKSVDVLRVVSGLAQPKDLGASHTDEPFIAFTDLKQLIAEATQPVRSRRQALLERIRTHIRNQVRFNTISPNGQVILEGAVHIDSGASLTYDRVALSSLACTLPRTWRQENPMTDYLRSQFDA